MVRRSRLAGARLVLGIGERANDVLFVLRRAIIGRDCTANLKTPAIDRKRFRSRPGERVADARAHRSGDQQPAPEQRAAIDETIGGNFRRRNVVTTLANAHGVLLANRRRKCAGPGISLTGCADSPANGFLLDGCKESAPFPSST